MLPVIAIVGRPNVGKSTLFNQLTRSRNALVADQPGLTRDRQYGRGVVGEHPYLVVDTGGLATDASALEQRMADQVKVALEEADAILFMVDGRAGLNAADQDIARDLRGLGKPIQLVVNKTDGLDPDVASSEFHQMGLGEPAPIAASHGRGVHSLIDEVLATLPNIEPATLADLSHGIRIAVLGRPNVGKSTLVNRMVGEERVLTFDHPGTTRDSIDVPFERDGHPYTLVDTAGVRRRARVSEAIEKFSIIKTFQAMETAQVVVVVLDARQGLTDQDTTLLGLVLQSGRALLIAVNKWDGMDREQRDNVKKELDRRLDFVDFASMHFISALHGTGVGHLFETIDKAYECATRDMSTPELTRILEQAVAQHTPPLVRGRRIKLRYAHQGGQNPPRIIIHGNQVKDVPDAYRRYLIGRYRKALKLVGTPIRVEFKQGKNPFQGRKNVLTDRQIKSRQRLKRFTRKKGK